jgi:hypothetical protein
VCSSLEDREAELECRRAGSPSSRVPEALVSADAGVGADEFQYVPPLRQLNLVMS